MKTLAIFGSVAFTVISAVFLTGCGASEKKQAEALEKINTAINEYRENLDSTSIERAMRDICMVVEKTELTNAELALNLARFNAGYMQMFDEGFNIMSDQDVSGMMVLSSEKALEFYTKAVTLGSQDAKRELGVFYMLGTLGEKNASKGLQLLEDPVFAQDAAVATFLGEAFLYGSCDMLKDTSKGEVYLVKGAELGSEAAQMKLAEAFRSGNLLKKDIVKACKWYDKAAQQGNVKAMLALFDIYREGEGVEKDAVAARKYLEMAVAKNDSKAKELLIALDSANKPAKTFEEFSTVLKVIPDDDMRVKYCTLNEELLKNSLAEFEGIPSYWEDVTLKPSIWIDYGAKKLFLKDSSSSLAWACLIHKKVKGSSFEDAFATHLKSVGRTLYATILEECGGNAPNMLKLQRILKKYEGCYIEIPKVMIGDVGSTGKNHVIGTIEWSDENPLAITPICITDIDNDVLKILNGKEIAPLESLNELSQHKVAGFIATDMKVSGIRLENQGFYLRGNVLK